MDDKLSKKMQALGIDEQDILEKFITGAGKGGQKINKTDSCVYLKHLPSKIEIKCQESRSREKNRYFARLRLCQLIEEIRLEERAQRQKETHLKRQQKRRRTRGSQEKMLQDKRHRSKLKQSRKTPRNTD